MSALRTWRTSSAGTPEELSSAAPSASISAIRPLARSQSMPSTRPYQERTKSNASGAAPREGGAGRLDVERHSAAEEVAGVQVAQDQVGVGDGWLRPTKAIARRARVRPGRVRADLEQAQGIHARDGAATGANLDHLD